MPVTDNALMYLCEWFWDDCQRARQEGSSSRPFLQGITQQCHSVAAM